MTNENINFNARPRGYHKRRRGDRHSNLTSDTTHHNSRSSEANTENNYRTKIYNYYSRNINDTHQPYDSRAFDRYEIKTRKFKDKYNNEQNEKIPKNYKYNTTRNQEINDEEIFNAQIIEDNQNKDYDNTETEIIEPRIPRIRVERDPVIIEPDPFEFYFDDAGNPIERPQRTHRSIMRDRMRNERLTEMMTNLLNDIDPIRHPELYLIYTDTTSMPANSEWTLWTHNFHGHYLVLPPDFYPNLTNFERRGSNYIGPTLRQRVRRFRTWLTRNVPDRLSETQFHQWRIENNIYEYIVHDRELDRIRNSIVVQNRNDRSLSIQNSIRDIERNLDEQEQQERQNPIEFISNDSNYNNYRRRNVNMWQSLANERDRKKYRQRVQDFINERDVNRELDKERERVLKELTEILNEEVVETTQEELPNDVEIELPSNTQERPVQIEEVEEAVISEEVRPPMSGTRMILNTNPYTPEELERLRRAEEIQIELKREMLMKKYINKMRKSIAPSVITEWYKKYSKIRAFKHKRAKKLLREVFNEWKEDAKNYKKDKIRKQQDAAREARLARFNKRNEDNTGQTISETFNRVDLELPDLTNEMQNKIDALKNKINEIKRKKVEETKKKVYNQISNGVSAPQRHEDPNGFDITTYWQGPPELLTGQPPKKRRNKGKQKALSEYNIQSGDDYASTSTRDNIHHIRNNVMNEYRKVMNERRNKENTRVYVDENNYLVTEDIIREEPEVSNMQYNEDLSNVGISTELAPDYDESIHPRTVLTSVPRPGSELYEQDIRLININTEEEETRREELVDEYLTRHAGPAKIKVKYNFINEEPFTRTYPFDIYKYKGRNSEVRGHYVLYYDKKKDAIGIAYIDPTTKGEYIPNFKPIFEKRNRFYLAVLEEAEISHLSRNDVYMNLKIQNSNNIDIATMDYLGKDYEERNDKYVEIPTFNNQEYFNTDF